MVDCFFRMREMLKYYLTTTTQPPDSSWPQLHCTNQRARNNTNLNERYALATKAWLAKYGKPIKTGT